MVVAVKKDSNVGGAHRKFLGDANYVCIQHADMTEGIYLHFRQNGVVVKVGWKVRAGQLLGYIGMTGFTSRPHIHFHVKQFGDFHEGTEWTSVPIVFRAAMGSGGAKGLVPKSGMWYSNVNRRAALRPPPWKKKKLKKRIL